MSVPAIASLVIFQFLWVWNDLLVALVYLGPVAGESPAVGHAGQPDDVVRGGWQFLTAAAFLSMVIPIAVFLGSSATSSGASRGVPSRAS